jgi:UDP-glucose 4-epimerase
MSQNIMQPTILVTGGSGFLGRAIAQKYKILGYRVVGIGHSHWRTEQALLFGYDTWLEASVSLSSLMELGEEFDLVVHCAGNSSVSNSLTNPLQDFYLGVLSTVELLEYLKVKGSKAKLVFPSSAAVYGACADTPIKEYDELNPISPYGYHKMIIETLLEMNSRLYGISVVIIRFFSIYGPGLRKQLLWDATTKLLSTDKEAVFWGTGEETRDWIYIDDAVDLIAKISSSSKSLLIVNGAGGLRVTVKSILAMLRQAVGVDYEIAFNGNVREGDPYYYHADISKLRELGIAPKVSLSEGISRYADWYKKK